MIFLRKLSTNRKYDLFGSDGRLETAWAPLDPASIEATIYRKKVNIDSYNLATIQRLPHVFVIIATQRIFEIDNQKPKIRDHQFRTSFSATGQVASSIKCHNPNP